MTATSALQVLLLRFPLLPRSRLHATLQIVLCTLLLRARPDILLPWQRLVVVVVPFMFWYRVRHHPPGRRATSGERGADDGGHAGVVLVDRRKMGSSGGGPVESVPRRANAAGRAGGAGGAGSGCPVPALVRQARELPGEPQAALLPAGWRNKELPWSG
ncbi:hypothetical protein V2A60_007732 [Cordyceps javanica]